jgi:hypothetical protein
MLSEVKHVPERVPTRSPGPTDAAPRATLGRHKRIGPPGSLDPPKAGRIPKMETLKNNSNVAESAAARTTRALRGKSSPPPPTSSTASASSRCAPGARSPSLSPGAPLSAG